jgi:hypothetical protein
MSDALEEEEAEEARPPGEDLYVVLGAACRAS